MHKYQWLFLTAISILLLFIVDWRVPVAINEDEQGEQPSEDDKRKLKRLKNVGEMAWSKHNNEVGNHVCSRGVI